ncbi:MAG: SLBB domain-containing protein [Fibrobacteria bacterium]
MITLPFLLLVQSQPVRGIELPPELIKKYFGDAAGKGSSADQSGSEGLDNSLDPQRYLVGGGDQFQISIVGMPSQDYHPVVDPEGNLYDGDLGLIPVGKVSLAKAKIIIAEKVKKSLRKNYEVYITISRVKTSTVSVTGTLVNPGTLSLSGNLRILDALKLANGGTVPSPEKFNLRRIRVRNLDSLKEYDLLRFLNKQDPDQNPYVYPGDLIAIDQVDSRVYVTGEVRDFVSGWVPLRSGETVGDILSLANLNESADSTAVLLQRSGGNGGGPIRTMTLSEAASLPIYANDVISIGKKETNGRPDTVQITGEVKRPGTYPVSPGGGSVETMLRLAGGATEYGSPERVFILRHRRLDVLSASISEKSLVGIPAGGKPQGIGRQSVRPEVASSFTDLSSSGDFTLLDVSGKGGASLLEDGDEIHIPRKENCIYISGNVRKPGTYPFRSGDDFSDYLSRAEGTTDKADVKNAYVLASYKGVTQIKDIRDISPGDIIVVPAAIEYKRWTNVFMPIIQIVPGILSLIVTIIVLQTQ